MSSFDPEMVNCSTGGDAPTMFTWITFGGAATSCIQPWSRTPSLRLRCWAMLFSRPVSGFLAKGLCRTRPNIAPLAQYCCAVNVVDSDGEEIVLQDSDLSSWLRGRGNSVPSFPAATSRPCLTACRNVFLFTKEMQPVLLSQGVILLPEHRRKDSKVLRLGTWNCSICKYNLLWLQKSLTSGNLKWWNLSFSCPVLPHYLSDSMAFQLSVFPANNITGRLWLLVHLPIAPRFIRDWLPEFWRVARVPLALVAKPVASVGTAGVPEAC